MKHKMHILEFEAMKEWIKNKTMIYQPEELKGDYVIGRWRKFDPAGTNAPSVFYIKANGFSVTAWCPADDLVSEWRQTDDYDQWLKEQH